MIKQSVDQERRYVTDKAMYFVGSFGGYNPVYDLIKLPRCTDFGYEEYSLSLCLDGSGNKIDICEIAGGLRNENGKCVDADNNEIYLIDYYYTRETTSCGFATGPFDTSVGSTEFLPEREFGVPYWKDQTTTCIPTEQEVVYNFVDIVNSYYEMDDSFVESINARYPGSVQVERKFYFTLDGYDKTDGKWIEYSWHPVDDTPMTLFDGPTEEESTVVYEAPYFVNSKSDTPFIDLYRTAKQFVELGGFDYIVRDLVRDLEYIEVDYIKNNNCIYYSSNDSYDCDAASEKNPPKPDPYDLLAQKTIEKGYGSCAGYVNDPSRTVEDKKDCIKDALRQMIMEEIQGKGYEDTGYNLTAVIMALDFTQFDFTVDPNTDVTKLEYKNPTEYKSVEIKLESYSCQCVLDSTTIGGISYNYATGAGICRQVFDRNNNDKQDQWPYPPEGLPAHTDCEYIIGLYNNGDKRDNIKYEVTLPTTSGEQTFSGTKYVGAKKSTTVKIQATSVCPSSCKIRCCNPWYIGPEGCASEVVEPGRG